MKKQIKLKMDREEKSRLNKVYVDVANVIQRRVPQRLFYNPEFLTESMQLNLLDDQFRVGFEKAKVVISW